MANVLAIKREFLFGGEAFKGFYGVNEGPLSSRLLSEIEFHTNWLERNLAEEDPTHKQLIAYTVLVGKDNKVFVYQRSKVDENYPEKRLQGKRSLGIGGHIKEDDKTSPHGLILGSMRREMEEEIEEPINFEGAMLLGFINLEYGVHLVHFGLLYVIKTGLEEITPKDPEIDSGQLMSIQDLSLYGFEEWSEIALKPIKKFLS